MFSFMFATGIENSIPTINGGKTRVDELEKCGFYKHWKTDFQLVEDLGIRFLRYGPPIHTTFLSHQKYDWDFSDATFSDLKRRDIVPIVDLCHFGVSDFIGNFQNPDFPALFEGYARDFARRYPWVQLYTPINEMYICATFSARYGWWNEQLTTDLAFVTALKHIVKANVLAMKAILEVRHDAIFVQSESSEYFHAENPAAIAHAEVMNAERFLSLDLNYGRRVDSDMYEYLLDNGMTRDEYHFFLSNRMKQHCILGNDYYYTNEHRVSADGSTCASGEIFGYNEITRQYYDRYRLPVMHTETNIREGANGDEAVNWLHKEWANVLRVRNDGIPVLGFTWYSLIDQVDWDVALREDNGTVNPLGLFDLDRNIRAVGKAYKTLISDWRDVLPTQSVCLVAPIATPSEFANWAEDLVDHTQTPFPAATPPIHPPKVDVMTTTCQRFTGKTALVTGAGGGIGLAIAERLAAEGAHLVLADLSADKLAPSIDKLRSGGAGDVLAQACDVSKEDEVASCVAAAVARFGRLDLVVNNAGLMEFKAIADLTAADWLKVLGVDLLGTAFFLRQAFLTMKPGGAVVNIASIHALQTEALAAPYAAAKAAVLSLTRTASIEGKPKGLRCNAVLPGAIDTPMLWDNPNVKSGVEKIDKSDVGEPADIAAAVAFLGSDDAAFITGAALNVDGGRLARL